MQQHPPTRVSRLGHSEKRGVFFLGGVLRDALSVAYMATRWADNG